jgi:hypothetical protein
MQNRRQENSTHTTLIRFKSIHNLLDSNSEITPITVVVKKIFQNQGIKTTSIARDEAGDGMLYLAEISNITQDA